MNEFLDLLTTENGDAAHLLKIIETFDKAIIGASTLDSLVTIASEITGLVVALRTDWNDDVSYSRNSDVDPALIRALARSITDELAWRNQRGYQSSEIVVNGLPCLVSSIDIASGRVGVSWAFHGPNQKWRPLDYLTLERLSIAAAQDVIRQRTAFVASQRTQSEAVTDLLTGNRDVDLTESAYAANIRADVKYRSLAVMPVDQGRDVHPIEMLLLRWAGKAGWSVRTSQLGHMLGVLAHDAGDLSKHLEKFTSMMEGRALPVLIGVGESVTLKDVPTSWTQACRALGLRSIVSSPKVIWFKNLGALPLLSMIPFDEVTKLPLFELFEESVMTIGNPSDAEVLEAYLEEQSLRKAASRVFLHHTSVESRLRKIEKGLRLDLADPSTRFQLLLLVKLRRMMTLTDLAST